MHMFMHDDIHELKVFVHMRMFMHDGTHTHTQTQEWLSDKDFSQIPHRQGGAI